jgi:nitrite reductase (NO-forming) / hydroxylamine reductase
MTSLVPQALARSVTLLATLPVLLLIAGHAPADAGARDLDRTAAQAIADGRALYLRHCARCHQQDGSGIEGSYPSLREAAQRWDSRDAPIRAVLAGRRGAAMQDGQLYERVMPTHGYLGNETVADTLSYVLATWGTRGSPFRVEEVAAVRGELLEHPPAMDEPLAGQSPLADLRAGEYVTGDGPPMSVADFERARQLYYGRCTGCHGVLREGTAGNPLTPQPMREYGTEYLRQVIAHGSVTGMPAWHDDDALDAEDLQRLALFLQHPVPQPPDLDAHQIRDSWHLLRPPAERPAAPRHRHSIERMFVAALHDVGEIALIDGVSRTVIARVPVGRAPHRVAASASGRYLYVIGRDGLVSLVDLYADPPERVASVRIGYEARTIAASSHPGFADRFVLAGAYWPPQLVMLDGRTLEPLRLESTRSRIAGTDRYHPEPRVSDIAPSPYHAEFISQIKETGHVLLFGYDGARPALSRDLVAGRELRAGSLASDGRHYITPTDTNSVTVLDTQRREVVARFPAPVFGANAGTSYVHAEFGPVWVTSSMVDDRLVVVGTDPVGHPHVAWRVIAEVPGPAAGSLFVASHPDSPHLWMDTPLTARSEHSQSVAVFRRDDLDAGYVSLPVAEWSGLKDGARRVLQPTFSGDGREVWLAVWNQQDASAAIVIVDDRTLELIDVIRDPTLVTPTRIYSLAGLQSPHAAAERIHGADQARAPADRQ